MSFGSTAERAARMRALIDEFSRRDLGCAGVAQFLQCSPSCARYYLQELLDGGAIVRLRHRLDDGAIDRRGYRLHSEELSVRAFLDGLARCAPRCATRRDPLVAALFGPG